jgi:hypothetical protein
MFVTSIWLYRLKSQSSTVFRMCPVMDISDKNIFREKNRWHNGNDFHSTSSFPSLPCLIPHCDSPFSYVRKESNILRCFTAPKRKRYRPLGGGVLGPHSTEHDPSIHTNSHSDSHFQNWQSHLMGIDNSGVSRSRGLLPLEYGSWTSAGRSDSLAVGYSACEFGFKYLWRHMSNQEFWFLLLWIHVVGL